MSGRIWVESASGQGSTFHFTVNTRRQAHPAEQFPALYRHRLRDTAVLVIDDNATNRRILEDALATFGMRPTSASDAQAGLAALKEASSAGWAFPLVILDATMSDPDGFTLAARIKKIPDFTGAIIMMLSSTAAIEDADRCQRLGINAYLTKPIRHSDLLDAIVTALGQSTLVPRTPQYSGETTIITRRRNLRVLLAEDNPVNQQLALRLLEKAGHSVRIASTGRQAIDACAEEAFDLVLMDVQMPEMSGFEATAAIRSQQTGTGTRVPIIAMTAHAMKGDRERCLAAGMDHYVTKPIDPKKLSSAIDDVFGTKCTFDTSRLLKSAVKAEAAEAQANHSGSRVDAAKLLDRVEGDRALLKEIVNLFLEDTPKLLNELRSAIDESDTRKIERAAHTLKGALGNFGVARAVELARDMEKAGRSGELGDLKGPFAELEREITQIIPELSHLIMEKAA
jgi:CheY-like chemotaxis protein